MRIGYLTNKASAMDAERIKKYKLNKLVQGDRKALYSAIQALGRNDYLVVNSLADIADDIQAIFAIVRDMAKVKNFVAAIGENYDSKRGSIEPEKLVELEKALKIKQAKVMEFRRRKLMFRKRKLHPAKYTHYIEQGMTQSFISQKHSITERQLSRIANTARALYPDRWADIARKNGVFELTYS